jgi:putative component of membrane protein insertase Oxa1/YidC/SpoIIIJ protein YidD
VHEALILRTHEEVFMIRRLRHQGSRNRIGRETELRRRHLSLTKDCEEMSSLRSDAKLRSQVRHVDRVRGGNKVRLLTGLIVIYQERFASKLTTTCVYEPSCSEYMLLALKRYGLWRGVRLGLGRLSRCRPGLGGEDYP